MVEYTCPVCGVSVKDEGTNIHDHLVYELSKRFHREGYKLIQEGKLPLESWKGRWCEPDLFVLQNLNLVKVVEVIVRDPYENGERSVKEKVLKIKEYYNSPEIIVFEPTNYLDQVMLPETKNRYKEKLGYEPKSYIQIEEHYAKKWKKEEELDVIFWNEENIR